MLTSVHKQCRSNDGKDYHYSVVIPSWNNLPYLRLCIKSLRANSSFTHQIIVTVNEGTDGTLDWVRSQADIDYVYSPTNLGICYGLNLARTLVKSRYLVYINDDMYLLPHWDTEVEREIKSIGHNHFLLSCTMIEPHFTKNPCVLVRNFGDGYQTFDEVGLLANYEALHKGDWNGSTWPPQILSTDLWDLVGGLSIEYSPGLSSEVDFAMKLWKAGVRHFKGIGSSKVYHFGSKTTQRFATNNSKGIFLRKWGILPRFFIDSYLRRGTPINGQLKEPRITPQHQLHNKIRLITRTLR